MAPAQFLQAFLLLFCTVVIPAVLNSQIGPGDLGAIAKGIGIAVGIVFIILAVSAPVSALIESLTEASAEGGRILRAFLLSPEDPFSYINNKNRV